MTPADEARLRRIKTNLEKRDRVIQAIRSFFRGEGFLEVETPLRVPQVAPELHITPFRSEGFFLSTSPELYMKRLLASGYDKIFQLTHSFRREERGRNHQPEFTILEWYRAHAGYLDIIQDTENLITAVARSLRVYPEIGYQGKKIDLTPPWLHITVKDAFLKSAGWDPTVAYDAERFESDLVDRVIPSLPPQRPVVLMDYPRACASLARLKPGDSSVSERAEVFIGGLELANGYSELNDPAEQERRFSEDIESLTKLGREGFSLPFRFLEALGSLPESGGIALGVDRLVMLFCDVRDIDEVMAFPWIEGRGLEG
ncbi:MAG: amino acid--tRNA ligase-related protein [Chloroflexota bacterium]